MNRVTVHTQAINLVSEPLLYKMTTSCCVVVDGSIY